MDVLYASLPMFYIREDLDLRHNSVLRGCDEQTVRTGGLWQLVCAQGLWRANRVPRGVVA